MKYTHSKVTSRDQPPASGWPSYRTIHSCEAKKGVLLYRYFLMQTKHLGIYLYHLMASDEDRALHDHPWAFVTVLLSSGYWEHTPTGRRWHHRFSILYRPALWQHRLELVKPTWTLIFRFKRERDWGFITRDGWMNYRAYGKEYCD